MAPAAPNRLNLMLRLADLTLMLVGIALIWATSAHAQEPRDHRVRAGALNGHMVVDGVLDEVAWSGAEIADGFTQADPTEGKPASGGTRVRVLAGPKAVLIGIECDDRTRRESSASANNVIRSSGRKITYASCSIPS
jgi:hypothetical protein